MPHLNIKTVSMSSLQPLIVAADGLTLSQVCAISGLEASTIQNWVKRGFVARPVNKKYRERQIARILLICNLRDCMKLESIGELMKMINGDANDENDDIIPEEKLYDYFCSTVSDIDFFSVESEGLESLTANKLMKLEIPDETNVARLKDALYVMVCAYASSEFKRLAEQRFAEMQNNCY